LNILFESKIIEFDGSVIRVNYTEENYLKLKEKYLEVYSDLALHYLEKKDASEFLFKYVKVVNSIYLPNNNFQEEFVKWYYDLYKRYGNELDDENLKEDYIRE